VRYSQPCRMDRTSPKEAPGFPRGSLWPGHPNWTTLSSLCASILEINKYIVKMRLGFLYSKGRGEILSKKRFRCRSREYREARGLKKRHYFSLIYTMFGHLNQE
jgi:hypothetical protein